jgi:ubiquinone/menaquinone biosynthesis C-methylase UbiE
LDLDLDAYRQASRETWAEVAPGWEARREWLMAATAPVNDWLADHARPRPGDTVLEIAAGTGDLGFRLAERVGPEGRLICSDFAPEMLDVARRNGQERGLDNVDYRVLDAERLELQDDSVDALVCRWGLMLMADPASALRECRRVLRAGGPLCFAVWRTPDQNPWASIPAITLVQRGHLPPPEPGAPGMFAMGDGEQTLAMVRSAGFADPQLEEIAFSFRYSSFDDLWDSIMRLAGPLARVVRNLPDAEREATRAAAQQSMAPFDNGDGSYTCPASSWGVAAA